MRARRTVYRLQEDSAGERQDEKASLSARSCEVASVECLEQRSRALTCARRRRKRFEMTTSPTARASSSPFPI